MIPVVTAKEMRECDRMAIDGMGIPSLILMENAGKGVFDAIINKYGDVKNKSFLIICGKGNNGGDGFVVARHLFNNGAQVAILLIGSASQLKGDAQTNYKIIEKMINICKIRKNLSFREYNKPQDLQKLNNFDIIIDAIFGTGFTGEVKGECKAIIERINESKKPVVSIDIPSGVNADTGFIENIAVKSDLTVTMGLRKIGLTYGKSINYINNLNVVDISIPKFAFGKFDSNVFQIESDDVRKVLPKRLKTDHKYSVGKVFILAGSKGYTGAAAMASQSAMRIGAGSVILGTSSYVYPILAKKLTEVMVNPLDSNVDGSISPTALNKIKKFIDWADIIIMGCGISLYSETAEVVWQILRETDKPILLDADALTIISSDMQKFNKRKSKNVILTPHYGEFSRLSKFEVSEIERNPINIAKDFAKKYNLTLILKGAPSLTVSKTGLVYINSTGNPGMATAGSGDVLAGIVGGLWSQKMDDFSAAFAGVYIHGLAGDIASTKLGQKSLMAMDIYKQVPQVINKLEIKD